MLIFSTSAIRSQKESRSFLVGIIVLCLMASSGYSFFGVTTDSLTRINFRRSTFSSAPPFGKQIEPGSRTAEILNSLDKVLNQLLFRSSGPPPGAIFDLTTESGRKQARERAQLFATGAKERLENLKKGFRDELKKAGGELVEEEIESLIDGMLEAALFLQLIAPQRLEKLIQQTNTKSPDSELPGAVPTDPLLNRKRLKLVDQWSWEKIGLNKEALEKLYPKKPGKPLIVALIDTGIDSHHPELRNQLWRNKKEIPRNQKDDDGNGYVDDVNGFDFAHGVPSIFDFHGHGTYSAGLLAARWNQGGIAGINPHVKVMGLKVTDWRGKAHEEDVAKAIRYAIDNGAKILQISIAFEGRSKPVEEAVALAQQKGLLVIAPASSHSESTEKLTPASTPGVLTVGACDRNDRRAPFSGWGPHLDVVAPGVDIIGLHAWGTDFLAFMAGKDIRKEPSGAILEKMFYVSDGSCSAVPFVTGAASLVWQKNPKLTAEQVKQILIMSCDDLNRPGWDNKTGAGRINLKKAMAMEAPDFLHTRITAAKVVTRGKQNMLQIQGQAFGDRFARRKLQLAYGIDPKESEWKTVGYALTPEKSINSVLGYLPLSHFNQKGRWSIRCIVEDRLGKVQESRGTILKK